MFNEDEAKAQADKYKREFEDLFESVLPKGGKKISNGHRVQLSPVEMFQVSIALMEQIYWRRRAFEDFITENLIEE